MAANLQQMAAAGQLIPQQQQQGRPNQAQLSNLVYRNLMANTLAVQGWQTAVQISERMGKTLNLITNVMLAMPSAEWQRAASFGLEYEKDAFHNSPDKSTYDQKMNAKNAEMFKKRQANEQNLHSTLNAQAAAAQAAQQQQQMLLNQQNAAALQGQMGRGMGQPGQQGFQHLQHPMQVSQIPQQPPQMAMNMGNPNAPQMTPNQPNFQMAMGGMRQLGGANNPPVDLGTLPPQDKQKVAELAQKLAATTGDQQKANMRVMIQGKLTPQQAHEFRTQNRDPLMWYFQQQAFMHLKNQAQMMRQQQQQGMPPNAQAALMQNQQRAMNPNMMNALGQAGGMAAGQLGPFSNMESIMNEQKAGFMAQEAGQIVVPANSGPGRNATPQPMGGMPPQNMPGGPGPNQTPRQPQMQQPFNMQQATQMKMDQAAAQNQAQLRAQQQAAKQLQGQPGGLGGPMPASQSPAMNTLNAPVRRPPVPMGQMEGQQMGPVNGQFGGVLDPRFNQQRPQISMGGNINANSPAVNAMLAAMPVEQRQKFSGLPPERLNELMNKWQEQQQQRAMQMNNAAQAVKNQPQMPGRPGQPQPGQFNPANPNPQFQMPNGMQQPNANVPPQLQQAYIQQQIARARMTGAPEAGQAAIIMDSMDVPQQLLQQFNQQFGGSLPPDIKKWKDFKTWLASNPGVPDNIKQGLLRTQQQQFRNMMAKRNGPAPANGAQPGMMPPNPQQPAGPMVTQPPNNNNNMPLNMSQIPPHMLQVTPQDIQTLRTQHPKLSQASDDAIRRVAVKIKTDQINKAMQAKQNPGQPGQIPQQQSGQMPQPTVTQAQVEAAQAVPAGSSQPASQKAPPNNAQASASNGNTAAGRNNRQGQQNQAAAPNPSPATAQKNLKRPNPDQAEAQAQAQAAAAAQAPAAQPNQRPAGQGMPMPTPEQLAKMTPEQRQKFEQMMKARAMAPEDMNRLKILAQEESAAFSTQQFADVPMQPAEKQEISAKITRIAADMAKLGRAIGKWYAIARDENRTRLFFKHRLRLLAQYQDGEKMQALKENFSISSRDLDQIRGVLETMTKDLAGVYTKHTARPNQANAPGQPQVPAQGQNAVPQPPQSAAQNGQAVKMHQRSNSKSGQPPAAPTSSQPPFAFGASSPHGQPSYVGKPTVTQENLQLPPPKKARKTQANASPSVSGTTASPHVKPPSPEAKRQQVQVQIPPKPLFVCPEPDCDSNNTGFATEEARKAHIEQEHVKPYQEPFKFFEENLAASLGLDSEGHSKTPPKSAGQDGSQLFAPPMGASLSKQGQTPMSKPDLAATPMSRAASMNRQASTTKANEAAKGTPGKTSGKVESTPKAPEIKDMPQMTLLEDPWAGSTIDPQNLFAQFNFDAAAGGVISDLSLYRSVTPNDTPESSKDSGVSEPTSDISEGAALEIDMNYQFGETGLLLDLDSFNIEGSIDPEALMMSDPAFSNIPPLDYSMDFDKPFAGLDMSMYSMDTS